MLIPIRFIVVVLTLGIVIGGCSDDPDRPPSESSPEEIADLRYMREEEKLARDVYLVLHDEWALEVFSNIARAEQRHTDAVARVIESLGIDDPVVDESIGVFVDQRIAALYSEMITRGMISSIDALHVGATIEELDIVDIQAALDRTDDLTISAVYESLLCGSRNHLRAYVGALEDAGHLYVAQFLDPSKVQEIVSSPREQCGS